MDSARVDIQGLQHLLVHSDHLHHAAKQDSGAAHAQVLLQLLVALQENTAVPRRPQIDRHAIRLFVRKCCQDSFAMSHNHSRLS